MRNDERQRSLDKKKWTESQEQGFDMSGCMLYCAYCEHADHTHPTENGKCHASQEKREKLCLCAKAYNRMARG
jgi:hypothetical protein